MWKRYERGAVNDDAWADGWADWWTYRPSDFLMFAPRTYWRLFERLNAELWPWMGVFALLTLAWVWARHKSWAPRALAAALAGWWALVAWVFHWRLYAPINWAASAFAIGFWVQAALWTLVALRPAWHPRLHTGRRARWGYALLLLACAWPAVGLLLGRPVAQAEWFGLAPDPTVLGSFGALLLLKPAARWPRYLLWPMPLLWAVISGLTLWVMASPWPGLLPAAALLALVSASAPWARRSAAA